MSMVTFSKWQRVGWMWPLPTWGKGSRLWLWSWLCANTRQDCAVALPLLHFIGDHFKWLYLKTSLQPPALLPEEIHHNCKDDSLPFQLPCTLLSESPLRETRSNTGFRSGFCILMDLLGSLNWENFCSGVQLALQLVQPLLAPCQGLRVSCSWPCHHFGTSVRATLPPQSAFALSGPRSALALLLCTSTSPPPKLRHPFSLAKRMRVSGCRAEVSGSSWFTSEFRRKCKVFLSGAKYIFPSTQVRNSKRDLFKHIW